VPIVAKQSKRREFRARKSTKKLDIGPRASLCFKSSQQKQGADHMPYVNIKITREGATAAQKAEVIKGVTELLQRVLNKNPATTFVVIDEVALEDWGIGGLPVDEYRKRNSR
jgi:4-oxalocrotonate tautomerase